MTEFKITLEAKGHRTQVLTEKDKNIRTIVDAWLYMFEQASIQESIMPHEHIQTSFDYICATCQITVKAIP